MPVPSTWIRRRPGGGVALLTAIAAIAAPVPSAHGQQITAFENVNVIPMDRERVLEDQTVVVQGGRIIALGPASTTAVPPDAVRVAARGKFLLPGLAEMHAHIPGPGAANAFGPDYTENVLFLYVAAGVTTIRGMLGHPSHFALQQRVDAGTVLGPRIWTSGPSVNGNSVPTPDSAVRAATTQASAGYDFIKIHPGLTRAVFDSLDAAADRAGIPYAGHVPIDVGLTRALEAGYWSIDHLDGYVEALAGREGEQGGWFGVAFAAEVNDDRIPAVARATAEAGVWNVPTQILMESYATAETAEAMARRPELRYVPARMRAQWREWKTRASQQQPQETMDRWIAVRRSMIEALHDAGAGLLLGSDAPQVWNVPGFSVHRELEALVAAGLTPYEALETGTRNVAVYFGTADDAGTIATGKWADLILLDANPLADIRNTTRRVGIMIRGTWHPQSELDARLQAIAAAYAD
jgi:imidazolonepropionase-like amidohydrolase